MKIHPTAIVSPRAELADDVEIGPFCIIEDNVRLGAGCRLWHHVFVTGCTTIEEGCEIHPGAILGHAPQDVKSRGELGACRIGRGTTVREYVTIHRGSSPEATTIIGEECFLLGGSHVAHDCVVGNRVTLINDVLLAGHVHVANRVTMGGSAVVHQFCRIGELAMISGNARVTQDIVPFALAALDGRLAGLNRIGMRRAELSREELIDVRKAYRILFDRRGLSLADATARLRDSVRTDMGRRILAFVEAPSKRGLAGRTRRADNPPDPEPADE